MFEFMLFVALICLFMGLWDHQELRDLNEGIRQDKHEEKRKKKYKRYMEKLEEKAKREDEKREKKSNRKD